MGLKFSVGLHGDKTYDTFRLWKHHVNAVINLRGVSTNKKYSVGLIFKFKKTTQFQVPLRVQCIGINYS